MCACGFGVLSLARERMAVENLTVIVFCLFLFSVSLFVSQASSPPSVSISLSLLLSPFPRRLSLSLSSPLYFDLCAYGGAAKNRKFESIWVLGSASFLWTSGVKGYFFIVLLHLSRFGF